MNTTIGILGCGWYGLPLAKQLRQCGYKLKGTTTSTDKLEILHQAGIEPYLIDFENGESKYDQKFFDVNILIISIPPRSKSPVLKDYPAKIEAIVAAIRKSSIKQVIFISSTGVFADGNKIITENELPNPDSESGKMMLNAEKILKNEQSFETTIIRFAGLIGPNRNLAKHFAGKVNIANGLAPVNLIHLDDCIALTQTIIEQEAFGRIYHGVSPHHPIRAEFYTKNCKINGMELPQFKLELLNWKQIESANVPQFLNYQYHISDWNTWLANLLSSS